MRPQVESIQGVAVGEVEERLSVGREQKEEEQRRRGRGQTEQEVKVSTISREESWSADLGLTPFFFVSQRRQIANELQGELRSLPAELRRRHPPRHTPIGHSAPPCPLTDTLSFHSRCISLHAVESIIRTRSLAMFQSRCPYHPQTPAAPPLPISLDDEVERDERQRHRGRDGRGGVRWNG